MQTPQPSLKRGRDYWDKINMPESEFQERVGKIRQEMKKAGVDTLLIYGRTTNNYADPCYVSNYMSGTQRAAMAIISPNDEIALIYDGFPRSITTAKSRTWIENVSASGNMPKSILEFLTDKKLIPSTIGFAGVDQMMTSAHLKMLKEGLAACKIIDCDYILDGMRSIKSDRELDQVKRAARINQCAFDSVISSTVPIVTEWNLTASLERIAYLEGAEDVRLMVARPQEDGWVFRPTEDNQLSEGDTLILYLAVESERYWAEGIRTVKMVDGALCYSVSDDFNNLYNQIVQGLKQEKSITEFCNEATALINASQFDYISDYGLFNGVGLSLEELPLEKGNSEERFNQGMCIALRLTAGDEKQGAMMIGNTYYLSSSGPVLLTR